MASRRARSEFPTEGAWGRAVREWLGERCAVCGRSGHGQADHIIPRAQQGLNDLANGWIICGDRGCSFHLRLTRNEVLLDPAHLRPEHLAYLAALRYVSFNEAGEPEGLGWRRFLPLPARQPLNDRVPWTP